MPEFTHQAALHPGSRVRGLSRLLRRMTGCLLAICAAGLSSALAAEETKPDVFKSGALAIIRDGGGAGSGFIAKQDGKIFLFTNAHVAAGMKRPAFTLLDGSRLTPISVEVAVGHDIIRFGVKEVPPQSMEIATSVEKTARINDEVVVFGNSGGGGVVTNLPGKLVGLGPDRIEVSSPFIPGNSGSPIIHVPTGHVLGIATYLTKERVEGERSPVTRRYGYRLDSVKKWEPVNWGLFQADADQVEKISALTEDIFKFIDALDKNQKPNFATETLRKPAEEWRATLSKPRLSVPDRKNATQSFFSNLRNMVRRDVVAAETSLHYSYFRDKLQEERSARDALYKDFDTAITRMSAPSLK